MKKIFTQLIIVGIFLSFAHDIHAKELNLSVVPSVYEVVAKKNKEITLPYTFVNFGDPDIFSLKIYKLIPNNSNNANTLVPYLQSETGITFRIDGEKYSLDTPFFLKSNEELSVDLLIKIPDQISEKDYYFTFVLEGADSGQIAEETAIYLQGGVGSNIYLTVSEDGSKSVEGKISLFEIPSKYAFSWGGDRFSVLNWGEPIPIMLRVANTGENLVKATGTITMSNIFSRLFKAKNPSVAIPKTFIPTQTETSLQTRGNENTTTFSNSISGFGVYTTTATIYLNENSRVLYDNAYLIILPISAIIRIVILLIIITVVITVLKRRKKLSQEL